MMKPMPVPGTKLQLNVTQQMKLFREFAPNERLTPEKLAAAAIRLFGNK